MTDRQGNLTASSLETCRPIFDLGGVAFFVRLQVLLLLFASSVFCFPADMTHLSYAVGCGGHVTSDFLFSLCIACSNSFIFWFCSAVQSSIPRLSICHPSGARVLREESLLIAFFPLSLPLEPMTGYAVFFLELASYDGRRIVALWLGKDEQVEVVWPCCCRALTFFLEKKSNNR